MLRLFEEGGRALPSSSSAPTPRSAPIRPQAKSPRRPRRCPISSACGWRTRPASPRRRARCCAPMPSCGTTRSAGCSGRTSTPVAEPEPSDNRFKDPEWSANPYFDFWKQAYLLTTHWAEDVLHQTEGLDERTRQQAEFYFPPALERVLAVELPDDQPGSGARDAGHQRREPRAGHVAARPRHGEVGRSPQDQPDRHDRLRGRQEPGDHARQDRLPERHLPAHPVCADHRQGARGAAARSCRRGSTSTTSSISRRRRASSSSPSTRASRSSSSRGSTRTQRLVAQDLRGLHASKAC